MLFLEQNITKKRWNFSVSEFELNDNKEYKVKAIWNSTIYAKKANGYLQRLYYLIAKNGYLKGKKYIEIFLNSHAPLEDNQHLPQRLSKEANSKISIPGLCLFMVKPIIGLSTKQKQGRPIKATKCDKWDNKEGIQVSSEATKKISESVWFLIELKASRWPEIYLPSIKSVRELLLAV